LSSASGSFTIQHFGVSAAAQSFDAGPDQDGGSQFDLQRYGAAAVYADAELHAAPTDVLLPLARFSTHSLLGHLLRAVLRPDGGSVDGLDSPLRSSGARGSADSEASFQSAPSTARREPRLSIREVGGGVPQASSPAPSVITAAAAGSWQPSLFRPFQTNLARLMSSLQAPGTRLNHVVCVSDGQLVCVGPSDGAAEAIGAHSDASSTPDSVVATLRCHLAAYRVPELVERHRLGFAVQLPIADFVHRFGLLLPAACARLCTPPRSVAGALLGADTATHLHSSASRTPDNQCRAHPVPGRRRSSIVSDRAAMFERLGPKGGHRHSQSGGGVSSVHGSSLVGSDDGAARAPVGTVGRIHQALSAAADVSQAPSDLLATTTEVRPATLMVQPLAEARGSGDGSRTSDWTTHYALAYMPSVPCLGTKT
jgi:hypothetical protein